MQTWLRHHSYALRIALRRLFAMPFSSITNITVISLVLALPLVAGSLLVSVQPLAHNVSVNPALTLFLKNTVKFDEAQQLAAQLQQDNGSSIKSIDVINKDVALKELKKTPSWQDALQVLPNNPLPNSIVITLSDEASPVSNAQELAQKWSTIESVDTVQFDSAWVSKLEAIIHFIQVILAILSAGVILIVIATIFNTVRMQAVVQREEIAVARLVGATEAFVRRPFLYLGFLTGLTSSLIAMLLTSFVLSYLNGAITKLSETYDENFYIRLPDTFWLLFTVIVTIIIAALAARWSITRNTRF